MDIKDFLDGLELLKMQQANRFCYNVAISRVQLKLDNPTYFSPIMEIRNEQTFE